MWQNVWNWLEACCITRVLINYNNFKNWRFFFSQSELYKIRIKNIYFFNCIIEIFPICWRFTRLLKISLNFRYIFVLTFPTTALCSLSQNLFAFGSEMSHAVISLDVLPVFASTCSRWGPSWIYRRGSRCCSDTGNPLPSRSYRYRCAHYTDIYKLKINQIPAKNFKVLIWILSKYYVGRVFLLV